MDYNDKIFNKMDKILERKKQIILYGVPGVGKTYLAKEYIKYVYNKINNRRRAINSANDLNRNYIANNDDELEKCKIQAKAYILRDICYLVYNSPYTENDLIEDIIKNVENEEYWNGCNSEELKKKLIEYNIKIALNLKLIEPDFEGHECYLDIVSRGVKARVLRVQ